MNDTLIGLAERVRQAAAAKAILRIRGGSTKQAMAGVISDAATLDMRAYSGIVDYAPSELVITARAGTPLVELERVLAERGQCLPFDPPRFADADGRLTGTVGGMVASGLAGPGRAAAGGVRDYVLGVLLLNGRGDLMHFGGQVIKNVAGYDVARLTAGSWGALGAICEVSLKALPMPVATTTLRFDMRQAEALEKLHAWAGQPLPLNASVWWRETLAIRLRGARAAVESAVQRLGGEVIPPEIGSAFWDGLRDQRDEFFIEARAAAQRENSALWRLSLPPTTPVLPSFLDTLIEWGGAQRWIVAPAEDTLVMHRAERAGGSAFRVSGGVGDGAGYATPLAPALLAIHRRLRDSFDPHRVFVPGRPMRFQDS
ncbi:MAG: glycolate oxidase subunit GlcE [Burkholderiales bacterium]|nr:glycolate oxidase subunit GlcE [Burkholderiales bacterium]